MLFILENAIIALFYDFIFQSYLAGTYRKTNKEYESRVDKPVFYDLFLKFQTVSYFLKQFLFY